MTPKVNRHSLSSKTRKLRRKLRQIHIIYSITPLQSHFSLTTNQHLYQNDDIRKMLEYNNSIFWSNIDISFKREKVEQLSIHNIGMTETFIKRFVSFQTVMLQMIKYIILPMIFTLPLSQKKIPLHPPLSHDNLHT